MLTINKEFSQITLSAGEAILFDLELQDTAGQPIDLIAGNYHFTLSFFDDVRTGFNYHDGVIWRDDEGTTRSRWAVPGTVSDKLYLIPEVRFQINERQDDSRNVTAPVDDVGRMTIKMSAPRVDDLDSAPIARYITRVVKKYDPTVGPDAVFSSTVVPYVALPGENGVADFSNPNNSALMGVMF